MSRRQTSRVAARRRTGRLTGHRHFAIKSDGVVDLAHTHLAHAVAVTGSLDGDVSISRTSVPASAIVESRNFEPGALRSRIVVLSRKGLVGDDGLEPPTLSV